MSPILLSIVVPTKNRYLYLKYLIQLVDNLHTDEVELVIQDNSDDNSEFLDYLNEKNYSFIRYSYIKGQIPMSENSDRAILNSKGEYVCFLGDDDGFTKFLIEGVRWMKTEGIDAVPSGRNHIQLARCSTRKICRIIFSPIQWQNKICIRV